ncbi:TetR family transcriptional regulator [Thiotrichales bacterium 19S3-7]|nr:TetR family transcriptional regulator [Thiotrichales bacterium 19S3-7]MCF6800789.1 TetR family transcriptional regulator [Thiotrichales bacterium 19S3-11]
MKTPENQTQIKIITSAKKLFVKNGFNGTSIRDIAKDAKVQVSLIYHYYENKISLWKAVKEALFTPELVKSLTECANLDYFKDYLDHFIRLRFDVYFSHPEILRLIDWQRLEDNDELIGIRSYSHNSIWQNLENIIHKFQQDGQVTKKYPPKYILLTINSAIFAPFMHSYKFQSQEEREAFISMIIDSMERAFKAG